MNSALITSAVTGTQFTLRSNCARAAGVNFRKAMEDYFNYISEWVGFGVLTPFLFVFAITGPFAIVVLEEVGGDAAERIKVIVGLCAFFASFFLFIGTAQYLLEPMRLPGKGMIESLLGITVWYLSIKFIAIIIDLRERDTGSKS